MDKVTHCITCGKELKYTTKKPKYCKKCNPFDFYKKPQHNAPPQKSKLEFQVQKWVTEMFPDTPFIANGYISWLPSPKGYPMQLDLWLYKIKIAIEIEGIQHEQKQYFQTQEEFDYLQECDKQKEWILNNKGIKLIKVPYNCTTKEQFEKLFE